MQGGPHEFCSRSRRRYSVQARAAKRHRAALLSVAAPGTGPQRGIEARSELDGGQNSKTQKVENLIKVLMHCTDRTQGSTRARRAQTALVSQVRLEVRKAPHGAGHEEL